MAVKLISTETICKVDVTTSITFVDEYDPDYSCVPTVARAYLIDGRLDKIELDGDDGSGMLTTVILRDMGKLSGRQVALICKILAACEV